MEHYLEHYLRWLESKGDQKNPIGQASEMEITKWNELRTKWKVEWYNSKEIKIDFNRNLLIIYEISKLNGTNWRQTDGINRTEFGTKIKILRNLWKSMEQPKMVRIDPEKFRKNSRKILDVFWSNLERKASKIDKVTDQIGPKRRDDQQWCNETKKKQQARRWLIDVEIFWDMTELGLQACSPDGYQARSEVRIQIAQS